MTSSPRSTSVDSDPPRSMRRYKRVDQELISPSSLPLQVRREGDSYVGFITPLVALYVTSTYAASLYSPKLFLGWFQHGVAKHEKNGIAQVVQNTCQRPENHFKVHVDEKSEQQNLTL